MNLLLLLIGCGGEPKDSPAKTPTPTDDTDPAGDSSPDSGTGDSAPPVDQPPGAAVLSFYPGVPAAGFDLAVVEVTPAVDPEGDAVTYRYAWSVDGVAVATTGDTVPGVEVHEGQQWQVVVTPSANGLDGSETVVTAIVANQAPSAVGLVTDPASPVEGTDLNLLFSPNAVDPDGDPITTTITWYMNDVLVSWFDGLTVIPGQYINMDDPLRVVVSVTDGFHPPVETSLDVAITFSCDNLPDTHLGDTYLLDARAYKGLVFDDFGNLIGYDGRGSIHKSRYDGTRNLFIPGTGLYNQFDRLPDGDFVGANGSTGELTRIDDLGATTVIATGLYGIYGVTVGPDGNVWVANGEVWRVDPATGDRELISSGGRSWSPHSLNFSLDSTVLYIGNIGSSDIYALDLDANLDPVGPEYVYASGVGGGYHDGIAVDVCGNLWVADYLDSALLRVETDGTVTSIYDINRSTYYGHGVMFGSGIDGWRTDALYLPMPYNDSTVREVITGFENGDTVRTWNGVAAPW